MTELSRDVAFQRAQRFTLTLAFADPAIEIGAGLGLVLGPDDRDRVDRVGDLAVAAVESVADALAGGRRYMRRPVAARRPLAIEADGVAGEQLGGLDRADARF